VQAHDWVLRFGGMIDLRGAGFFFYYVLIIKNFWAQQYFGDIAPECPQWLWAWPGAKAFRGLLK